MRKISVAMPSLSGNEKKYVDDCMDTTWISSNGKYVREFQNKFAEFLGVRHAIACCNGTVTLHLPLLAWGIGPGDEVLVPTFTYIATANVVRYCGATPVLVDCLPDTWNIDMKDAEAKITERTKAIIPVHLYGNPCDMDAVMEIARKHNLLVLEDAAECHGAEYKGKKAGTIGDAAAFSFFGNKIITTGEGGMVTTNNDELADRISLFRGQGQDLNKRYWFIETGYNYRMTNVAAAIGLGQMENVEAHINEHIRVAEWYKEELKDLLDEGKAEEQKITEGARTVWWMYSILLGREVKISRDDLMEKLSQLGIETRPLFYPLHIMPAYKDESANCPVSEDIASRGINLPTHAGLTKDDIKYICDNIRKYIS